MQCGLGVRKDDVFLISAGYGAESLWLAFTFCFTDRDMGDFTAKLKE
ncbi:MAG: hypothetical protein ACKESB_02130 [Candidatus Hodgkinia cicadicola]